jgi:hypothetical protein
VFENRVLRRIVGLQRDEVTGDWRKLHKEKLYDLYSSNNLIQMIKKNEMGGTFGTYGRQERCIRDFGGKI